METRSRSLVKALVWQGLGLVTMSLIGWVITGSVGLAGGLAVANITVGFVAYLLHERLWARISWENWGNLWCAMRGEGPTILILVLTYAVWAIGTTVAFGLHPAVGIVLTGLAITQFSSLQHEALHGHPFRSAGLNEAVVAPAITLTVPYRRFRDTHLAHHHDPCLTDPYDDPESNYFDPAVWAALPRPLQALFRVNNTLLGRMVLGPVIGNVMWLLSEARLFRANAPAVRRAWLLHALGLVPVVAWLWAAAMPWWAYVLAAWIGHGVLKIRTFLEHRAHETARARTVVVEDRGPLSVLFLNNNFHSVHHCHPGVAWHQLPALYAGRREAFCSRNEGYIYRSYAAVFRAYFLRAKDPVPHPLYARPPEDVLDRA